MSGIEAEVLKEFLTELTGVPTSVSAKLAILLAADKLPKAEELAALYTEASGETAL